MAGVLLRCVSLVGSSLRNVTTRKILNFQVQVVRSYSLSRHLLAERKFTSQHEWIEVQDGIATVGVSSYAQDKLGDIVYVQLPEVGDHFDKDAEFGALESVKAASELYSPLTGKITDVNSSLEGDPSLVNSSPYGEGWIIKMDVENPQELDALMDEEKYNDFTANLD